MTQKPRGEGRLPVTLLWRRARDPSNPGVNASVFCRAEITDFKHRVQAIRDLVKQLPKPNHDTMQALFKHLRK